MPFVADNVAAVAACCSGNRPPVMTHDKHGVITAHLVGKIGGASYQRLSANRFKLFGRTKALCAACRQHDREDCVRHSIPGVSQGISIGGEHPCHKKIAAQHLRRQRLLCISSMAAAALVGSDRALRENKESQLRVIQSIEDAKSLEGVEVGLSDWVVIDQNRIDQFAEATGDYQWIHVDTERAAREMPEGKTIAHGYLTLALIPALTGNFVRVDNLARAINFGVNKVRFYSPVPVGARVRGRATVLQARRRAGALLLNSQVRIEVDGERKPACVAETLGMYFFKD